MRLRSVPDAAARRRSAARLRVTARGHTAPRAPTRCEAPRGTRPGVPLSAPDAAARLGLTMPCRIRPGVPPTGASVTLTLPPAARGDLPGASGAPCRSPGGRCGPVPLLGAGPGAWPPPAPCSYITASCLTTDADESRHPAPATPAPAHAHAHARAGTCPARLLKKAVGRTME